MTVWIGHPSLPHSGWESLWFIREARVRRHRSSDGLTSASTNDDRRVSWRDQSRCSWRDHSSARSNRERHGKWTEPWIQDGKRLRFSGDAGLAAGGSCFVKVWSGWEPDERHKTLLLRKSSPKKEKLLKMLMPLSQSKA